MTIVRGLSPVAYRKSPADMAAHRRRLVWLYGEERAAAIMLYRDPEANADLAAWNALGSGRERAA